uniref:Uncharacterized protein n=1 Tax=Timema monikensis TaxID=170555 RepID=A0A7R9E955_9NEOP|nr:unnamed protein product [Timema monikensis]
MADADNNFDDEYFSSHPPVYEKYTKIFVWNCVLHSASDVVFDCCAHAHIGRGGEEGGTARYRKHCCSRSAGSGVMIEETQHTLSKRKKLPSTITPEPALREQQCFLYLAVPPSSPPLHMCACAQQSNTTSLALTDSPPCVARRIGIWSEECVEGRKGMEAGSIPSWTSEHRELVSSNTNQRNWRGILIALLVIVVVLALIVTSVVLLTPPDEGPRVKGHRFKLQDILGHDFAALRFNGSWVSAVVIRTIPIWRRCLLLIGPTDKTTKG